MANKGIVARIRSSVSLGPLVLVMLYAGAIWFTEPHFMADTGGYVVSILAYEGIGEFLVENPVVRDYRSENAFWEFGHLFWRPTGLLLFKIFQPVSSLILGPDPALNVLVLLRTLTVVAGLVSLILLYALTKRLTGSVWAATLVAIALIFSHGFLNFSQTGSSYITGLAFLISGLYLLLAGKDLMSQRTAIGAGLAFAGAVTTWTVYVMVIPAAIAAPLVLFGISKERQRLVLATAVSFVLFTAVSYTAVMAGIGVHNTTDLGDWMRASTHGVTMGGVHRVIFGLPRSFIDMGNDGIVFKRFLLGDPFNPVSAIELLRLSLWKIVLFYLAAGSVVLALFHWGSKRVLALLALTTIPLIGFAIIFDGGALERYLPLYPIVFLSAAWVVGAAQVPRLLKVTGVLFFAVASITNAGAMAASILDKQQQVTAARVEVLLPRLKPNSWIVTSHLQDDLVNFQASYPFHAINRGSKYRIYPLLVPNSAQVSFWRERFAMHTIAAWANEGDVWLSTRLLSPSPRPEWRWAEGDDPTVSWKDIYTLCSQLEAGPSVGGTDGFVPLLRTARNEEVLEQLVNRQQSFAAIQ